MLKNPAPEGRNSIARRISQPAEKLWFTQVFGKGTTLVVP
jgi:hypothetical protein